MSYTHPHTLGLLHHAATLLRRSPWDWPIVITDPYGIPWTIRGRRQLERMRDDPSAWPREVIREASAYAEHTARTRAAYADRVRAAGEWYGAGEWEPASALMEEAEAEETALIAGRGTPILAEVRAVIAYGLTLPPTPAQHQVRSMVRDQYHASYTARDLGWSEVLQLSVDGWAYGGRDEPVILTLRR